MAANIRAYLIGVPLLMAGCVSSPVEPPKPAVQPVRPASYSVSGLETVMGHNARSLESLFGKPDLDVREGTARKLQFISPVCVLDTYLYPPRGGGDAIVTYMDARLPDGRDVDRASCVAALSRREEAR
jgi:hypothetical protein